MSAATFNPLARLRDISLRQSYTMALAGALGAVCGLYLFAEPQLVRPSTSWVLRGLLSGAIIGGTIGFFLNAVEPLRDGAWLKLARTTTWGALSGAVGGAAGLILGEVVLKSLGGGLAGRSLSWAVLGLGIGVSQGLAYRSAQRLVYGVLGGTLGGFIGGLLFEWFRDHFSDPKNPSFSQGLGIVILGAGLGLCLALVEQVLRRAWVQVLRGRQEGNVYLLAKRHSALGLDERAEVGLFGDPTVARRHAEIEATGQSYLLRSFAPSGRTKVNGQVVQAEQSLQDGDRIELGNTLLVFRQR